MKKHLQNRHGSYRVIVVGYPLLYKLQKKIRSHLLCNSFYCLVIACATACRPRVVLQFSSGGELSAQEKVNLELFMQRNSGIEVRPVKLPALSMSQHDSYVTYLSSGEETVDVFAVDVIWLAEFANSGWIAPLDEFFSQQARDIFLPALLQAGYYQNRLYGIPGNADTGMVFVNLALARSLGHRVPENFFWQAANTKTPAGMISVAFQATASESLICNLLEFFPSDAELLPDWHRSLKEQTVLWRTALTQMLQAVRSTRQLPLKMAEGESAEQFLQGRALYLRNWPYMLGLLRKANKQPGKDFAILPMATRPTIGGWYLVVNANSPYKKEAAALVQFLTSEEVQLATLEKNYGSNDAVGFPSAQKVYRDKEWLQKFPELEIIKTNLAKARARFISPHYYEQSRAAIPEIYAYLAEKQSLEITLRRLQEKTQTTEAMP